MARMLEPQWWPTRRRVRDRTPVLRRRRAAHAVAVRGGRASSPACSTAARSTRARAGSSSGGRAVDGSGWSSVPAMPPSTASRSRWRAPASPASSCRRHAPRRQLRLSRRARSVVAVAAPAPPPQQGPRSRRGSPTRGSRAGLQATLARPIFLFAVARHNPRTVSRTARSASESGASRRPDQPEPAGWEVARSRTCAHRRARAGSPSPAAPTRRRPAATRSAMSRMPSTSTGTGSVTPRRARRRSISRRSGLPAGRQHRAACSTSRFERHRVGCRARRCRRRRARRAPRRAGARPTSRSSRHRLGDDRLRELARSAPRRAAAPTRPRSRAARRPARAGAEVGDERGDEPPARGADDAEAGVAGPGVPCSMARSSRIGSSSRRMRRARSRPTSPTRSGRRPCAPGPAASTPSSASSWRTCSETFDCTVARTSAAAVNEPSSAIAIRVSRCRSSIGLARTLRRSPLVSGSYRSDRSILSI